MQLDSTHKESEVSLEQLIAPYRSEIEERVSDTVGFLDHAMAVTKPQSELGNLLAGFLRDFTRDSLGMDCDFALFNKGGFRIPLPGGAITERHMLELMPFDNTIVVLSMPYPVLSELAHQICRAGGDPMAPESTRIYCQGSETLIKLEINGEMCHADSTYIVITSNYLADGGDRYTAFGKATKRYDTGVLVRDALRWGFQHYTNAEKPGTSAIDNRFKIVP